MDMAAYILTMAILCRASLKMEEGKEKVDGLRRTAVITKVILEIMSQMDMENTLILVDIGTKDNGKIIFQTVKDKHYTLTDLDIMVNFWIIKNMEKESLSKMEKCMTVVFPIIKWMAMAFFNCKTVKGMRDSGFKIRKMELEYTLGLTEVSIKEFTSKERDKGKEKWYTKTTNNIRVSGKMGRNTEREFIAHNRMNFMLNGKKVK
jgi:hypothetical protein